MKVLILLLAISPFAALSQKQKDPTDEEVKKAYASIPKADGQYEWSEVVQVDSSIKKDDLYKNAKIFFTNEFKSGKDVLQYDDRGEGKVIGKGNFQIEDGQQVFLSYFVDKYIISFSLEIFCKDGRYRYRIYAPSLDYRTTSTESKGPGNVSTYSGSIDVAYERTQKGVTKKMDRRLFISLLSHIDATINDIKKSMVTPRKDEF